MSLSVTCLEWGLGSGGSELFRISAATPPLVPTAANPYFHSDDANRRRATGTSLPRQQPRIAFLGERNLRRAPRQSLLA